MPDPVDLFQVLMSPLLVTLISPESSIRSKEKSLPDPVDLFHVLMSPLLVTPIASLTPYQNKWTIKARVTSKGDIRTWNKSTGSGKLFSFDLMDDSGEIRVTAFNEQCDRFYEVAQAGQVFYIANCTVKSANKQYSRLNNDYELSAKDSFSMEPVQDASDVP